MLAEVSLSQREACAGHVVPLDVPVRGTCRDVRRPRRDLDRAVRRCRGTGESLLHHAVRVPLPPGVADGARFRFRV